MTSAVDPDPVQVPIPFSDPQTSRNGWGRPAEYFGLYSKQKELLLAPF